MITSGLIIHINLLSFGDFFFLSFFLFFIWTPVGVLALTSLMVLFTSASFQDFQTRQLLTLCISSFLKNN